MIKVLYRVRFCEKYISYKMDCNKKYQAHKADPMVKALSNEVVGVIRDLVRMNPLFREQTQYFTARVDMGDPFKLADFAASLTTADGPELQEVSGNVT